MDKNQIDEKNNTTLDKLSKAHKAKIISFLSENIPSKIFEFGLVPGSVVKVYEKAPFGGPISLQIEEHNMLIAIRRSEAKMIVIHPIA